MKKIIKNIKSLFAPPLQCEVESRSISLEEELDDLKKEQTHRAYHSLIKSSIQRPLPSRSSKAGQFLDSFDNFKVPISGVPLSSGILNWYSSNVFIGYQLAAIFAQHWLIDKACRRPAADAFRKGFQATINDGSGIDLKVFDELRKGDKEFKLHWHLKRFIQFGRIFGIRHILFLVESSDPEYYFKPFNLDGVRPNSYRGMVQIDPFWITPELSDRGAYDPADPHFLDPEWWTVNGKRIHRTHFCIYRHSEVADILKPTYFYGGIPLPQLIFEHVYDAERTAAEAPRLAMTKRMLIYKTNIAQYEAKQNTLRLSLARLAYLRDNFGVNVCDKTRDEITQLETALGGFYETMNYQYQLVAGGADMPITKFLGTSPGGFNSTGEYEEASYHETLEDLQTDAGSPIIERHQAIYIRSHIMQKFKLGQAFETTIKWNKLDAMTEKEESEIKKMDADTALVHVTAGITAPEEERERLASDPGAGYDFLRNGPKVPSETQAALEKSGFGKIENRQEMSALKTEKT